MMILRSSRQSKATEVKPIQAIRKDKGNNIKSKHATIKKMTKTLNNAKPKIVQSCRANKKAKQTKQNTTINKHTNNKRQPSKVKPAKRNAANKAKKPKFAAKNNKNNKSKPSITKNPIIRKKANVKRAPVKKTAPKNNVPKTRTSERIRNKRSNLTTRPNTQRDRCEVGDNKQSVSADELSERDVIDAGGIELRNSHTLEEEERKAEHVTKERGDHLEARVTRSSRRLKQAKAAAADNGAIVTLNQSDVEMESNDARSIDVASEDTDVEMLSDDVSRVDECESSTVAPRSRASSDGDSESRLFREDSVSDFLMNSEMEIESSESEQEGGRSETGDDVMSIDSLYEGVYHDFELIRDAELSYDRGESFTSSDSTKTISKVAKKRATRTKQLFSIGNKIIKKGWRAPPKNIKNERNGVEEFLLLSLEKLSGSPDSKLERQIMEACSKSRHRYRKYCKSVYESTKELELECHSSHRLMVAKLNSGTPTYGQVKGEVTSSLYANRSQRVHQLSQYQIFKRDVIHNMEFQDGKDHSNTRRWHNLDPATQEEYMHRAYVDYLRQRGEWDNQYVRDLRLSNQFMKYPTFLKECGHNLRRMSSM